SPKHCFLVPATAGLGRGCFQRADGVAARRGRTSFREGEDTGGGHSEEHPWRGFMPAHLQNTESFMMEGVPQAAKREEPYGVSAFPLSTVVHDHRPFYFESRGYVIEMRFLHADATIAFEPYQIGLVRDGMIPIGYLQKEFPTGLE